MTTYRNISRVRGAFFSDPHSCLRQEKTEEETSQEYPRQYQILLFGLEAPTPPPPTGLWVFRRESRRREYEDFRPRRPGLSA